MWHDDPLFGATGALHHEGSPVFRLTGYFPYEAAHPYRMALQWQDLFACFEHLLQTHCDRVIMWDRPGAKARRSRRIAAADWQPFEQLLQAESEVAQGIFTGFHFLDRSDRLEGNGRGPCSLRFFVGSAIRFEACVPLDDWAQGRLDLARVLSALQALPYVSALGGFGLSLAERFSADPDDKFAALAEYARRHPAVDVGRDEDRSFFSGPPADFPALGVAGINWLTGVGEPFRSQLQRTVGRDAAPPPAGVELMEGPHGTLYRLGAAPVTGQTGVSDATLPLYRWLGARIAKVYFPHADDPRAPVFGAMRKSQSLEWERRFYPDGQALAP